jgi:Fic family protein
MAYIHRKRVGNLNYYTLRVSVRKGSKVIAKDLANLGNDLSKINIEDLNKKYSKEIRKSYKNINKFLKFNHYLDSAQKLKLKSQEFLNKEQLEEIEAIRLHYQKEFLKQHKDTQKDILEYFLIRFAVNSTAIEGNTITLKEATELLINQKTPKNKLVREIYDLENTKKVFNKLIEEKSKLDLNLIINIHDELLEMIDERKGLRTHDIYIYGQPFKPTPYIYVKSDLILLLKWYFENINKLHPFVLAIFFHHKFEQIHPFSDGNGRTGRMLMNKILIDLNYPPIVIDKRDRLEYIDKMNKADKSTKKNLVSISDEYKPLIEFVLAQTTKSYWDIFL